MVRWGIDWLEKRAKLTPDKIALLEADGKHCLSYSELEKNSSIIGCWLIKQGVKKGDRVALIAPNMICYFELLFACSKIGAIFVPINWRLSIGEITYVIKDCTPKIVFFHSEYDNNLSKLKTSITSSFLQIDKHCFDMECVEVKKNNDLQLEDPLIIIYTGGTTGKPKGVVLSHEAILWNGLNTIVSWDLSCTDTTITYLPMFHTGGLNALSIPLLMVGGKVVIASNFDPVEAVNYLNEHFCTIVLLVPTMYHMIVQTNEFKHSQFPSMKTFLSGGAPCPLELYDSFHKKNLLFKEGYGLTEAGPNNFYIDPLDARRKKGSVGKPMVFNDIRLLNEEGNEVGVGEVGEVVIGGKHIFSYYWNNLIATEQSIKEGWLYTGDLAKKDKEGYYYIVGRKKDMIITGGENVFPLEIENWIASINGVAETAVVGLPDPKWGEIVSAFIVLSEENILQKEDILAFCKEKLGVFKIPKQLFFLETLPKTHVGKINKKILKQLGARLMQK